MMKRILYFVIFLFPLFLNAQKPQKTSINGVYLSAPGVKFTGTKVMLQHFDYAKNPIIDSARIDSTGKFIFNTMISNYDFYRLFFNGNNTLLILVPGEKTTISIDPTKNYQLVKVESSSNENKQFLQFRTIDEFYKAKSDSIQNVYKLNNQNGNVADNAALQNSWVKMDSARKNEIAGIVQKNPSLLSNIAFIENIGQESFPQLFELVANSLFAKFNSNVFVKEFYNRISAAKATTIGNLAPDIIQKDTAGNIQKLSNLRGKWVIIDFWASWCRPCRAENPHMVQVYNKYNSQGLEIFGVSLDKNDVNWKQAIVADGIRWTQVSDLKYWDAEPAKVYGVKSIPATVIINPEGKVVAKNLRGEELDKLLLSIFKN